MNMQEFLAEVKNANIEKIKEMLDNGYNIKENDDGLALQEAILSNNIELAKILIQANSPLEIAIYTAANKNLYELVEEMLKKEVTLNEPGTSPLIAACKAGHDKIVKLLLEHNVDININNGQPLFMAVNAGHERCVELLLKNGADINLKHRDDIDLHKATGKNKYIKNLLLEYGLKDPYVVES